MCAVTPNDSTSRKSDALQQWGLVTGVIGTASALFGAVAAVINFPTLTTKLLAGLASVCVTGALWWRVRDRTRGRISKGTISWLAASGLVLVAMVVTLVSPSWGLAIPSGRGEAQSPASNPVPGPSPSPSMTPTAKPSPSPSPTATPKPRVTTGGTPVRPVQPPTWVSLADIAPATDPAFGAPGTTIWRNGPVTMGGHRYAKAMSTDPNAKWATCLQRREYDLGARFERFTALVGIIDAGSGTSTVDILVDDKTARSVAVQVGEPVKVDLDISGAKVLGLRAGCPGVPDGPVALGDPRLYAAP
jgi:hypothetical protein